jgi:hypothetical protein
MNSDTGYLYLDVTFNPECTEVNMKLGVFMYTEKLGFNGGKLTGDDALYFLKNTNYGRQPDLINYFWLFSPDAKMSDLPYNKLTVEIPPIKDIKFKNNKFDRKRRAFKTLMMSIPCVKKLKIILVSELQTAANAVTDELRKSDKAIDQKMITITNFLGRLATEAKSDQTTVSESDQKLINEYYAYIQEITKTK